MPELNAWDDEDKIILEIKDLTSGNPIVFMAKVGLDIDEAFAFAKELATAIDGAVQHKKLCLEAKEAQSKEDEAPVSKPDPDDSTLTRYKCFAVPIHKEGDIEHILLEDIPEDIKEDFGKWFAGQGGLMRKDARLGVFTHDWQRYKEQKNKETP